MAEQIPTIQGLEAQFGSWNPMTYIKASDYSGLADQFRNQDYQQEQNTTQKGVLENQQSSAMNPMLLEQQGYVNNNAKSVARTNQLAVERAEANQQDLLNADQRKAALSLSADEITQMGNHITKTLMNPQASQVEHDQAIKMQQFLPAIQAEQRKHKEKMEEVAAKEAGDTKRTGMMTGSAERIRQMEIDAGRFKDKSGGGGVSITAKLMSGKMKVPERLGTVKSILDSGINPDTGQPLSTMEQTYLASMYDQDAATTEGRLAIQGQGITVRADPSGGIGIVNKEAPSVRPNVSAIDQANARKATGAPKHSLASVQQQYPGVPAEVIRERYKKKFGVDLQ